MSEETKIKILSCREQIQEDIRTMMDGTDSYIVESICEIAVTNFAKLLNELA